MARDPARPRQPCSCGPSCAASSAGETAAIAHSAQTARLITPTMCAHGASAAVRNPRPAEQAGDRAAGREPPARGAERLADARPRAGGARPVLLGDVEVTAQVQREQERERGEEHDHTGRDREQQRHDRLGRRRRLREREPRQEHRVLGEREADDQPGDGDRRRRARGAEAVPEHERERPDAAERRQDRADEPGAGDEPGVEAMRLAVEHRQQGDRERRRRAPRRRARGLRNRAASSSSCARAASAARYTAAMYAHSSTTSAPSRIENSPVQLAVIDPAASPARHPAAARSRR